MGVAGGRAGAGRAAHRDEGDVNGVKAAVVLGVGDGSAGLDHDGELPVVDEVLDGSHGDLEGDVPVLAGPLDLECADEPNEPRQRRFKKNESALSLGPKRNKN